MLSLSSVMWSLATFDEENGQGALHYINVKFSLCLTKHYVMMTHGERMYTSRFSWPVNDWRFVVRFMRWPLYPSGKSHLYSFNRGWVDPRTSQDDMKKWKFLALTGLELPPLVQPARSHSLYQLSCRYCSFFIMCLLALLAFSRVPVFFSAPNLDVPRMCSFSTQS
jgi:hypothetical protein